MTSTAAQRTEASQRLGLTTLVLATACGLSVANIYYIASRCST